MDKEWHYDGESDVSVLEFSDLFYEESLFNQKGLSTKPIKE